MQVRWSIAKPYLMPNHAWTRPFRVAEKQHEMVQWIEVCPL